MRLKQVIWFLWFDAKTLSRREGRNERKKVKKREEEGKERKCLPSNLAARSSSLVFFFSSFPFQSSAS